MRQGPYNIGGALGEIRARIAFRSRMVCAVTAKMVLPVALLVLAVAANMRA